MSRLATRVHRLERQAGISPFQASGPSLADAEGLTR